MPETLRPLRLLNLYRVVAAGVLFVLILSGERATDLGAAAPELFTITAGIWLGFGLVSAFTIQLRSPPPLVQLHGQLLIDIVAVTLLSWASGGMGSGLGGLLFVPVAAGSLLAPQRSAIVFAAAATLALLGAEVHSQLVGHIPVGEYTQAGIFGMILFTTSVAGYLLASRARESEALAAQRGVDLANLAQLNEFVIQHLATGVIVVDGDGRIRMLNASAAGFLGTADSARGKRLADVSSPLAECLADWRRRPWDEPPTLSAAGTDTMLIPHVSPLGRERDNGGVLVFLEDARVVAERMQAMKLAALGRLTASIAHEIRNPLGAVSHAGQLLAESAATDPESRRLMEIIHVHTDRVNSIIENVLQLSRREQTRPEQLALAEWLARFVDEFAQSCGPGELNIAWRCAPEVTVRMDPSHLQQVLWNLCENALRHGFDEGIEIEVTDTGSGVILDVLDRGPGVRKDVLHQIFEPFFSARESGTGLGLFIARELCECNRARLSYRARDGGGACFRIHFADANRWVV